MTALAQLRSHIVLGFGSLCMLLSLQRHSLNTLASTKQIPSFQMFIWTKQVTRHLCVKVYRMVSPSVILVYSTVFLNAAIPQVNSFFYRATSKQAISNVSASGDNNYFSVDGWPKQKKKTLFS